MALLMLALPLLFGKPPKANSANYDDNYKESQHVKNIRLEAERDALAISEAQASIKQLELDQQEVAKSLFTKNQQIDERLLELDKAFKSVRKNSQDIEQKTRQLLDDEARLNERIGTMNTMIRETREHWDHQLTSTIDSVKSIQDTLEKSLIRVDNSLRRLNEQEIVAQNFNQKITDTYSEVAERQDSQRHSLDVSNKAMVEVLDETLVESQRLLEQLKHFQHKSEQAFDQFNDVIGGYEEQAYERFDALFNEADSARQELNAGLEESRQYINELKAGQSTTVQGFKEDKGAKDTDQSLFDFDFAKDLSKFTPSINIKKRQS